MKTKITILENGTREEACKKFDEVKNTISDFKKETVSIRGDIHNPNEGWKVIKIIY